MDGAATPRTADAVIIGAGSFGCAAAHRLAAAGLDTVLVDRFEPASQTSPRAAGNTKQIRPQEVLTRLAIDSVEKIVAFAEETGVDLPHHQTGSLHLARTEDEERNGRHEFVTAERHGVAVEEVQLDELEKRFPYLRNRGVRFAWYSRDDLYLHPPDLLAAYLEAARRSGCKVIGNFAVTGVLIDGDKVRGVETSQSPIHSPVVIDTAGGWSHLVAARAGIQVPLIPMRHQVFVSQPTEAIAGGHPITRILDVGVYMRPCEGGVMFGGFERDPQIHDPADKPPDFQVSDLEGDQSVLDSLVGEVSEQVPFLEEVTVKERRVGLPTLTPDNLPIVGPIEGLEGFLIASGCCVGGLSISPSVGELLTDLAQGRGPRIPIDGLYLARFADKQWSEDELEAACRNTYSGFYVKKVEA
jgi:glycine/D-amino acid oxidase-like deaminating enzyme